MENLLNPQFLNSLPNFIAVEYQNIFTNQNIEEQTNHALHVYELIVRTLAISLVSQYLFRDQDAMRNYKLNNLLREKLPNSNPSIWQEILFTTLDTYKADDDLLFIRELYDLYSQKEIIEPCIELLRIRYALTNKDQKPKEANLWQSTFEEVMKHLNTILEYCNFFDRYELILITHSINEGEYSYICYQGIQICDSNTPIITTENLTEGHFYFSNKKHDDFLELHPLLILWDSPQKNHSYSLKEVASIVPNNSLPQETAIYESYGVDTLSYRISRNWAEELIYNNKIIREFIDTIQQMLEKKTESTRIFNDFTWEQLQEWAFDISKDGLITIEDKFQSDLYVRREKIHNAFDQFLSSDKNGFIITGKSGVGKSNFIMSLLQEYKPGHSTCCLFIYNGAKLTADTFIKNFTDDINHYIGDPNESDGPSFNIWQKIQNIKDIDNKKVIICLDAINENPHSVALQRELDKLIVKPPFPWLKVVITSRPEAWKAILGQTMLARSRYYFENESDDIRNIITQVNPGIELTEFSGDEIRIAYERYKNKFNIITDYQDLSIELKETLSDPLELKLVSSIFSGKELPSSIIKEDIYGKYIDYLITSQMILDLDFEFLKEEFVPRLISEERIARGLTNKEITDAKTKYGISLRDLINDTTILKPATTEQRQVRFNQSYENLANAELLVKIGTPTNYEISFKFERFYDYFAGRQIGTIAEHSSSPEQIYIHFLNQVGTHPYIWGPLKNAIFEEVVKSGLDKISPLAKNQDETIRRVLVQVIVEYAKTNGLTSHDFLKDLVKGDRNKKQSGETIATNLLAIDAAGELKLPDILVDAALNNDATVRLQVAKAIHLLWHQGHNEVALTTLSLLKNRLKNRNNPLPNFNILEILIGASTLIVFDKYDENSQGPSTSLQLIWRSILNQLLFINENNIGKNTIDNKIRYLSVFILVRIFKNLTKLLPPVSSLNIPELDSFFSMDTENRRKYANLLPYLDSSYGTIDELAHQLFAVAEFRDIITQLTVWIILSIRINTKYPELEKVLDKLFEQALLFSPGKPGPIVVSVLNALYYGSSDSNCEYAGPALDKMCQYIWKYYDHSFGNIYTEKNEYQYFSMDLIPINTYRLHGEFFPEGFQSYIDRSVKNKDYKLQRILVGKDKKNSINLLVNISDLGYPNVALKILELIIIPDSKIMDGVGKTKILEDVYKTTVMEGVYETLAKIYQTRKEMVEQFIKEQKLDIGSFHVAEAKIAKQTIGEVLALVFQDFIWQVVSIPEIHKLFTFTVKCRSTSKFLELVIQYFINMIYGMQIFTIEK